jgi:hypothetical protein
MAQVAAERRIAGIGCGVLIARADLQSVRTERADRAHLRQPVRRTSSRGWHGEARCGRARRVRGVAGNLEGGADDLAPPFF